MYFNIPKGMRKKIYCFTGVKEDPNWYCMEYRISAIAFGFDKEAKKPYFNFVCDNTAHLGAFIVISLKQMLVLRFKHRVYFSEKQAKRRQHMNWKERGADE